MPGRFFQNVVFSWDRRRRVQLEKKESKKCAWHQSCECRSIREQGNVYEKSRQEQKSRLHTAGNPHSQGRREPGRATASTDTSHKQAFIHCWWEMSFSRNLAPKNIKGVPWETAFFMSNTVSETALINLNVIPKAFRDKRHFSCLILFPNSLDKPECIQQMIFTAWWWETSFSGNVATINIEDFSWWTSFFMSITVSETALINLNVLSKWYSLPGDGRRASLET